MRNAQDARFLFHNYILASDVPRLPLGQGWQRHLGVIAYLSYLFSLRVRSETLQLTVAIPNEKPQNSPHRDQRR